MKTIDNIRRQLSAGEFELSRHAFKRAVERNISDLEIRQAGEQAKIIEDYPDDKYAPSCLLLGFNGIGRPLHGRYHMWIQTCSRSLQSMCRMKRSGMITRDGGSHVSLSYLWEV